MKYIYENKNYNFVTERVIDGKRVQFFRGDNPEDEIQVEGKKIKKVKIKEWQTT